MKLHIDDLEYNVACRSYKVKVSRIDGISRTFYYRIDDKDYIFNKKLILTKLLAAHEIISLDTGSDVETLDLSDKQYHFYFDPSTRNLTFVINIRDLEWVHSGKVNQWKEELELH